MAIRIRIPQQDRARQFASFDALKGLQESLKLEEYKHDMIIKGDIQEEKANEISLTLSNLKKNDYTTATYYEDGHYHTIEGITKLILQEGVVLVGIKKININDLIDIKLIKNLTAIN